MQTAAVRGTVTAGEAFRLAVAHQNAGRLGDAAAIYDELLLLGKNNPDIHRKYFWQVCNNLVMLHHFGGDPARAIGVYSAAILEDDRHYPADFESAYVAGLLATGTAPVPFKRRHRLFELLRFLDATRDVPGEVAECGCFLGLSSFMLCTALRREAGEFRGAGYHIFDSFAGLSEPAAEDGIADDHPEMARLARMCRPGHFAASIDVVADALADFPAITLHPGWIPASFDGLAEREYRFVHVDVDLHQPTRDALNYFFPRLATGGCIVSDDYGWPGARKAIDDFCTDTGAELSVNEWQQARLRRG